MKIKLWLQARLILSFSVFIIVLINIFLYLLFLLVESSFLDTTYRDIKTQYETIISFIPETLVEQVHLPDTQIQRMQTLNFFYLISTKTISDTEVGFHDNEKNEIYYTWKHHGFTIIVWKKITDLKNVQQAFIQMSLVLNLIAVFFIVLFSYLLSKVALTPLKKLSKFLSKYDIRNTRELLTVEKYGWELGIFAMSLNHFLTQTQGIFQEQRDFIQDVTHELKTPLMQIQSSLDILETKTKDESQLKKISGISWSIAHMNETLSKLSFLLRWDEANIYKENIDLEDFLKEFVEKYRPLAAEKNIMLQLRVNASLQIHNSPYYLERLFWNILSNAIFYNTWNNTITLSLNETSVCIQDEWIGISPEELSKIFQRFYRNPNSITFSPHGSGLGLALVERICKMFGWKLSVSSEVGKGSEFTVAFTL